MRDRPATSAFFAPESPTSGFLFGGLWERLRCWTKRGGAVCPRLGQRVAIGKRLWSHWRLGDEFACSSHAPSPWARTSKATRIGGSRQWHRWCVADRGLLAQACSAVLPDERRTQVGGVAENAATSSSCWSSSPARRNRRGPRSKAAGRGRWCSAPGTPGSYGRRETQVTTGSFAPARWHCRCRRSALMSRYRTSPQNDARTTVQHAHGSTSLLAPNAGAVSDRGSSRRHSPSKT